MRCIAAKGYTTYRGLRCFTAFYRPSTADLLTGFDAASPSAPERFQVLKTSPSQRASSFNQRSMRTSSPSPAPSQPTTEGVHRRQDGQYAATGRGAPETASQQQQQTPSTTSISPSPVKPNLVVMPPPGATFPPRGDHVVQWEDARAWYAEVEVPRFRPEHVALQVDERRETVTLAGRRTLPDGTVAEFFEKRFVISGKAFSLAAATHVLELGIARITVPRSPPEPNFSGEALPWPPQFQLREDAGWALYFAKMPPTVREGDIHLRLGSGDSETGLLNVRIATTNALPKWQSHTSRRVLNFSVSLPVPETLRPDDIVVGLRDGVLRIAFRLPL